MSRVTSLELLEVADPCPIDWDALGGDERRRFCARCGLDVYNLSSMTREDASRLVEERTGRLCVRFARTPGGRVETLDYSDERPRDLRRRRFLIALASLGGLAAAAANFFGVRNSMVPGRTVIVGDLPLRPTTGPTTFPAGAATNPAAASLDDSSPPTLE
jgi:hypothetical protein